MVAEGPSTRSFGTEATAMASGVDDSTSATPGSTATFPLFPGEDFLAHAASQYRENAETALAARELLAVANNLEHPNVKCIIDVDLSALPALDAAHRDHNRREEYRIKVEAQNRANAEKRYSLTLKYWTEVYTLLKRSTETTAPVLSKELKDSCDLSLRGVEGGYFDGPRAWLIVQHKLSNSLRSEADKDFYRAAERLQRASTLPDGCQATEYSKKAMAFLVKIKPFLPQSYDDDDTSQYLISLMPKVLRGDGRRIKAELVQAGRYHDHMHVIQTCRAIVHEEQKAPAPAPALVALSAVDLGNHDLDKMRQATGMLLSAPGDALGGGSLQLAAVGGNAGGKWCGGCPHGEDKICFQDPSWAGPAPINIFLNKERYNGILAAKAANARKAGVANATVKEPAKSAIDAFLKAKRERREKGKARETAKKAAAAAAEGTAPGGAAADDDDLEAWRASLMDVMMVATDDGRDDASIIPGVCASADDGDGDEDAGVGPVRAFGRPGGVSDQVVCVALHA